MKQIALGSKIADSKAVSNVRFSLCDQMIAVTIGGLSMALDKFLLINSFIFSGKLIVSLTAQQQLIALQSHAHRLVISSNSKLGVAIKQLQASRLHRQTKPSHVFLADDRRALNTSVRGG
jgi:hypothetical protein